MVDRPACGRNLEFKHRKLAGNRLQTGPGQVQMNKAPTERGF